MQFIPRLLGDEVRRPAMLGLESERELSQSSFFGAIFEGFVASEILKHQIGSGRPRQLYYFRDQQGLEVDFLASTGHRRLGLVEAQASRTTVPHPHGAARPRRPSRCAPSQQPLARASESSV